MPFNDYVFFFVLLKVASVAIYRTNMKKIFSEIVSSVNLKKFRQNYQLLGKKLWHFEVTVNLWDKQVFHKVNLMFLWFEWLMTNCLWVLNKKIKIKFSIL